MLTYLINYVNNLIVLYYKKLQLMVLTASSVLFWFIILFAFTIGTAIPSYGWQRLYRKKNHKETLDIMKSHYAKNLVITKKVAYALPKGLLWLGLRIPILKSLINEIILLVERLRQAAGLVSKKSCGE